MKHMSHSVQASTTAGKIFAFHAVQFFRRAVVDQVEQAREGIAQIEAAPAAVTDVEHPAHLGVELLGIVKSGSCRHAIGSRVGASRLPSRDIQQILVIAGECELHTRKKR